MSKQVTQKSDAYLTSLMDAIHSQDVVKVHDVVTSITFQKDEIDKAVVRAGILGCPDIANYLISAFEKCNPWSQIDGTVIYAFDEDDFRYATFLLKQGGSVEGHEDVLFFYALTNEEFDKLHYYLELGFDLRKAFTQEAVERLTTNKYYDLSDDAIKWLKQNWALSVSENPTSHQCEKYDTRLVMRAEGFTKRAL